MKKHWKSWPSIWMFNLLPKKANLPQIILEGEDVTEIIRTEKIGNAASIVAALPAVRAALLAGNALFVKPLG